YSRITGIDASGEGLVAAGFSVDDYPGSLGTSTLTVNVAGPPQPAANPPAGNPAPLSSLAAAGGLASFVNGTVTEVPGQHADFYSEPLPSTVDVVGAPAVSIRAASPLGEAVLFVKLYDVDEHGQNTLPDGLVAPVRLTGLPPDIADAKPVRVVLPGIVHRFEAGHRLRITVATADQAYATPVQPTVYTVGLDPEASAVTLPTVSSAPIVTPDVVWRYVLAGLVALIALGLALAMVAARRRLRRHGAAVVAEHAQTPLVVRGLRKEYGDGFLALSTVDFMV